MSTHFGRSKSEHGFRDVVCIVGPTGSGKSQLALSLAEALNGEIVNCDSLQLFRGFDIGTAKPSEADQSRVPHHLLDVAGPGDDFTAGDYARVALPLLHTLSDRGKLPVVAGGTGFYLKAVIDGLVSAPRRDLSLRQRLQAMERRAPGRLHRLLRRWDTLSAMRIQPNDVQKLIRALEVMLQQRQPLSSVYQQPREAPGSLRFLQIGLDPPRELLYRRLNARCEAMWQSGLLDEVRGLLAAGYSPSAKPFGAIGYKQALRVVQGSLDPEAALEEMQRDTRRYAKRQWTWFRRDPRVYWIPSTENNTDTHGKVVRLLYKKLFWY
ncbi:MAG: tRNA (adenosine(37)-N6)-dimethylallyltransferase MiaA [Bryobacterales bacterium]|nr:tRNA (adenosine(37)-N6)-dimethylallyltransferase MiaA [Bryobacterales bacterium]